MRLSGGSMSHKPIALISRHVLSSHRIVSGFHRWLWECVKDCGSRNAAFCLRRNAADCKLVIHGARIGDRRASLPNGATRERLAICAWGLAPSAHADAPRHRNAAQVGNTPLRINPSFCPQPLDSAFLTLPLCHIAGRCGLREWMIRLCPLPAPTWRSN
jgi:hypothetical protein